MRCNSIEGLFGVLVLLYEARELLEVFCKSTRKYYEKTHVVLRKELMKSKYLLQRREGIWPPQFEGWAFDGWIVHFNGGSDYQLDLPD